MTLTASSARTFSDLAAAASEPTGGTITFALIDEDEWVSTQEAAGQPEFMARFLLGMFQAAQGSYFAGVDPLVGVLLGREPKAARELLAEPSNA